MKHIDKLFIDHVNKLRTDKNTVMIEAILKGFDHFVKSIKVLTESHEDFMTDDELRQMSDDEAKAYIEKISDALTKMHVSDAEIRSYLTTVHKRLFKDRLALQGKPSTTPVQA